MALGRNAMATHPAIHASLRLRLGRIVHHSSKTIAQYNAFFSETDNHYGFSYWPKRDQAVTSRSFRTRGPGAGSK